VSKFGVAALEKNVWLWTERLIGEVKGDGKAERRKSFNINLY
jgi:hypothetical protein